MQKYLGIDPIAAIQSPEQLREALYAIDRQLRQLGRGTQGESESVPTVQEDYIVLLNDLAVPIAGVETHPGGKAHFLRTDTSGVLLVKEQGGGGTITADTELPSAAALNDGLANPTTPVIAAYAHAKDTGVSTYSRVTAEDEAETGTGNSDDNAMHVSPLHKLSKPDVSALDGDIADAGGTDTHTVTDIDVRRFNWGTLAMDIAVTGAPTDLRWELWGSNDGTNYQKKSDGFWADNRLDDTALNAQGSRKWDFPIRGDDYLEIRVIGTGLGAATPKFTISNARLGLRAT